MAADNPIQTQTLQYVGILMRQNFLNLHRAFHAILRKHGMQQHVLEEWARQVDEGQRVRFSPHNLFSLTRHEPNKTEIGKGKRHTWARYTINYARRRAGPKLPAPALPASSSPSEPVIDSSQPPFATYEEWHTQEEALAHRERLIRTGGDLPRAASFPSLVPVIVYFELIVWGNTRAALRLQTYPAVHKIHVPPANVILLDSTPQKSRSRDLVVLHWRGDRRPSLSRSTVTDLHKYLTSSQQHLSLRIHQIW
ncbi:hypothetical protein FRC17_000326 [Serendipita sp. 399]|nr:hypothetical protein FRC17_000326 [Serendipita sp. 399]